jgi:hypothetical protein
MSSDTPDPLVTGICQDGCTCIPCATGDCGGCDALRPPVVADTGSGLRWAAVWLLRAVLTAAGVAVALTLLSALLVLADGGRP